MRNVRVMVRLKQGVLDPQGKAIEHALQALGFPEAQNVRVGKIIEFALPEADANRERVKAMCDKLLANPVIEDYEIEGV